MNEGILWGIPYHSWPCPAHHFTDGLALFRSIAMGRTILASCLLFAIRHTCNDQDDDKRSLPDASIHPALCPDEDDGDNTAQSSYGLFASLAQSWSFHSAIFHFFTLFIILFTLTNGRFSQSNPNHCCPFETSGNSIIESIHMMREKTLADSSQTSNLLFVVCHNLCLAYGGCRFVL